MDIFNGESASDAGLFWGLTPLLLAMVFLAGCDARSEAQHAGEPPEVDVARVRAEGETVPPSRTSPSGIAIRVNVSRASVFSTSRRTCLSLTTWRVFPRTTGSCYTLRAT